MLQDKQIKENQHNHSSDNHITVNDTEYWIAVSLEVAKLLVTTGLSLYFGYKLQSLIKSLLDPMNEASASAVITKKALAKRLQRPEIEDMDFDSHEMALLNEILGPDEIKVTFSDIGGMEEQLEEVTDNIVLPMQLWSRYRKIGVMTEDEKELSSCPTGMLLYGSPGTGKSLTAKAVAKESGATFINIKASNIMNKYVGESDKMVSAIFRLGRKLAPTVIFIDEIDTVLRKRSSFDSSNGTLQSMQGVFLAEWDGLNQSNAPALVKDAATGALQEAAPAPVNISNAPVVVLGATNRPSDLDDAFMRRMPVQIQTLMPDITARAAILRAQLKNDFLSEDVDITELSIATSQFSGSDIRELIRIAKQHRAKKVILSVKEAQSMVTDSATTTDSAATTTDSAATTTNSATASATAANVVANRLPSSRPLSQENFLFALQKVQQAAAKTNKYGKKQATDEIINKYSDMLKMQTV